MTTRRRRRKIAANGNGDDKDKPKKKPKLTTREEGKRYTLSNSNGKSQELDQHDFWMVSQHLENLGSAREPAETRLLKKLRKVA